MPYLGSVLKLLTHNTLRRRRPSESASRCHPSRTPRRTYLGRSETNNPGLLLSMRTVERARNESRDLARSRVSSEPRLFENRHSIQHHFEPSAARWNQLDLRVRVPLLRLSRQTGGSWLIVSKSAVFDRDLHWILSLSFEVGKYLMQFGIPCDSRIMCGDFGCVALPRRSRYYPYSEEKIRLQYHRADDRPVDHRNPVRHCAAEGRGICRRNGSARRGGRNRCAVLAGATRCYRSRSAIISRHRSRARPDRGTRRS